MTHWVSIESDGKIVVKMVIENKAKTMLRRLPMRTAEEKKLSLKTLCKNLMDHRNL